MHTSLSIDLEAMGEAAAAAEPEKDPQSRAPGSNPNQPLSRRPTNFLLKVALGAGGERPCSPAPPPPLPVDLLTEAHRKKKMGNEGGGGGAVDDPGLSGRVTPLHVRSMFEQERTYKVRNCYLYIYTYRGK